MLQYCYGKTPFTPATAKGASRLATLITTLNIVLPIFLLIVLGLLLRLAGVLDQDGCAKMNSFCFRVLVPAMIFYNIYTADTETLASPRLLLFCLFSVTAAFGVLMLVVPRLEKDRGRAGVMVQGIFRSSFVVLGMGLATSMYPGQDMSIIAIASTVVAPLFNGYSVVALEVFSQKRPDLKKIALDVVRNPLIIASGLALLMLLSGIRFPAAVESTIHSISGTATTISLIVLGGGLTFEGMGSYRRALAVAVVCKLFVLPALFLPVAVWMGFREMELLCLLILFASPSPVTASIMARNTPGADWQLAGQIVVFSTTLSVVSLFCVIYTLLRMGLL